MAPCLSIWVLRGLLTGLTRRRGGSGRGVGSGLRSDGVLRVRRVVRAVVDAEVAHETIGEALDGRNESGSLRNVTFEGVLLNGLFETPLEAVDDAEDLIDREGARRAFVSGGKLPEGGFIRPGDVERLVTVLTGLDDADLVVAVPRDRSEFLDPHAEADNANGRLPEALHEAVEKRGVAVAALSVRSGVRDALNRRGVNEGVTLLRVSDRLIDHLADLSGALENERHNKASLCRGCTLLGDLAHYG